MRTKAVRLYGKRDLRMEEFDLPAIGEGEILARVVLDSICMSTYKAAQQGAQHKRVPEDIAQNPVIIGHEFCGEILEVGKEWASRYTVGERFVIQPALQYRGSLDAPGYSYPYIGGAATHVLIPREVMLMDCLLPYRGDAWYYGALTEPLSCVAGAFHAMYHTQRGSYAHTMGIRAGGSMAILAGAGPMGLAAIDYILHCDRRPALLVVTDIDDERLARAKELLSPESAQRLGVRLLYCNTAAYADACTELLRNAPGGFDDVLVFAPVPAVAALGDALLGQDGCLNFFAGPSDPHFSVPFNFYNVHYVGTHVVGTSGGNAQDMRECLGMMEQGLLDPSILVTHIGGLNSVIDTTLRLPSISGGKKLVYTGISLPMTAIADFAELGEKDELFAELDRVTKKHNGLWSPEAERLLLGRQSAV